MAKLLSITLLVLALAVCVLANDSFYVAELTGNGPQATGRTGIAFLVVLQGTHTVQGYIFHNAPLTLKSTLTFKTANSNRPVQPLVTAFKSATATAASLKGMNAQSFSWSQKDKRDVAEGIWNGSLYLTLTFNSTYNLTGFFEAAQNYFFANLNGTQNNPTLTVRNTTAVGFGFSRVKSAGLSVRSFVNRKKVERKLNLDAWAFNVVPNSVAGTIFDGTPASLNSAGLPIAALVADSVNGTTRNTRFFGERAAVLNRQTTVAVQSSKSYIRIDSQANPTGDVRGQLKPFTRLNALLTGISGGKIFSGVSSSNYGATQSRELASTNFDSKFVLSLDTDSAGKFDAVYEWALPRNLQQEAFGRESFPLVSVQGIRINFNILLRNTPAGAFSPNDWKFSLLPKDFQNGSPLVLGTFNGYKRRNKLGNQRFLNTFLDIDGTTLQPYLFPDRSIKIHIEYAGSATDTPSLALDQCAIQVWFGSKTSVSFLRSLGLVPLASSLLPQ